MATSNSSQPLIVCDDVATIGNERYDETIMRLLIAILIVTALACGESQVPLRSSYDPQGGLTDPPETLSDHNVVLISIDTLRADHLGSYGYKVPTSPNIDRLARGGAVFEYATSSSPWTTPSHISMMTSLHPESHGVLAYPTPGVLNEKAVTLAEILQSHGWRTAGFTEGGYAKGSTGLAHGFEAFPSWPRDEEGFISHELEPSRLTENAERAIAWLDDHAAERFFLFFHTYEPHFEYRPPSRYLADVAPWLDLEAEEAAVSNALVAWNQEQPLSLGQKGILARHRFQGDLKHREIRNGGRLLNVLGAFVENQWRRSPRFREDLRYLTALYDAEIRFVDDLVGRLVAKLEAMGVREKTLIIITSDHGEGLMERGVLQHGFHLHTEVLHVPLIIDFPGDAHAGTAHAPRVQSVDIVPTVLDWIGLPVPELAQGESLLSTLGQEADARAGFAQGLTVGGAEGDLRMYSQGRWKFLRDAKTGSEMLFDVEADPRERVNVIRDVEPAVVERLRAALESMVAENTKRASSFPPSTGQLTEPEIRRLKALGYLID